MYKCSIYLTIFSIFLISCAPKIHKSGIDNIDVFSMSFEGLSKKEIIKIVGTPSSIDPIDKKLIYFSEIKKEKNIFNNKILSRNVYVIKFDNNDIFVNLEHYEINDSNKLKISEKTTKSKIIKTGLIERIFGGVGNKKTLTTN